MDVEKICRTCLALSGPLLSIFDGGGVADGSANCLADMLSDFTKTNPKRSDKMPEKVCLTCISEIMRCYSFKMKCENSSRTLRQLLPDAMPEESTTDSSVHMKVVQSNKSVQTTCVDDVKHTRTVEVQTAILSVRDEQVQTLEQMELDMATSSAEAVRRSRSLLRHPKTKKQKLVLFLPEEENINIKVIDDQKPPLKHSSAEADVQVKWKSEQSVETIDVRDDDDYIVVVHDDVNQAPDDNDEQKDYMKQKLVESVHSGNQHTYYELSNSTYEYEEENAGVEPQNEPKEGLVSSSQEAYKVDEQESEFMQLEYSELVECEEQQTDETNFNYTIYNNEDGETELVPERRKSRATKAELKCSECTMTFISDKTLKRHMLKRHNSPTPRQSLDSCKQSDTIEVIEETEGSELTMQKVVKPSAAQKPRTRRDAVSSRTPVTQPIITQAPPVELNFFCDRCNAGFAVRKSLNYHRKLNVCTVQSFKCDECERVFNSDDNLLEHKATHVLGHFCSECTHVSDTKEDLSQHMIEEHKRNIRNQCVICKKVFTILSALKDHMRVHSGEKPYMCPVCSKCFSQNANLKQHVMRHSKEKRFHCDMCDKRYVTKAELLSHHRTHTGDQPFKCEFCSHCFTSNSSLVKHKRKHTGERPYACEMCPMRFSALNVLKNHRRTHTGEKPYTCVYCNKSFTQKGDCQIHQRTHTGERNYSCYCGEKFTHMGTLRTHMKIHDREANPAGVPPAVRASKRRCASTEGTDGNVATNTHSAKHRKRVITVNVNDEKSLAGSPIENNESEELEEELVQISIDEMCQTAAAQ